MWCAHSGMETDVVDQQLRGAPSFVLIVVTM